MNAHLSLYTIFKVYTTLHCVNMQFHSICMVFFPLVVHTRQGVMSIWMRSEKMTASRTVKVLLVTRHPSLFATLNKLSNSFTH